MGAYSLLEYYMYTCEFTPQIHCTSKHQTLNNDERDIDKYVIEVWQLSQRQRPGAPA